MVNKHSANVLYKPTENKVGIIKRHGYNHLAQPAVDFTRAQCQNLELGRLKSAPGALRQAVFKCDSND